MKIVLLSDLHLLSKTPENRCDDILTKQWDKLEYVLNYCQGNCIEYLFQAGDWFDIPRNWETFNRTVELLKRFSYPKIYVVEGQHDKYFRSEDTITNLSLLDKLGLITIIKESIQFSRFILYGISFKDEMNIDKEIDNLKADNKDYNILVIHAPISDAPLFPGHAFSKANLLLKKHSEFNLILCGDIHKEFKTCTKKGDIVNTGCMIRKERNEYNQTHQPCFFVANTQTNEIEKYIIPHEPFDKVFSKQERIIESDILTDFIYTINNPVESDEMDIYKRIERFILDNQIEDGVVQQLMEVTQDA